jgi:SAM-dependent methyltransferase
MLGSMQDGDPVEIVRAHFDALGEGEWDRLVQSPRTRVSLELHRRMLARFVQPGSRVLEVGAGPGRYTIVLADLDATVVVSDVSAVQLSLNEVKVADARREHAVEYRLVLDVRDLTAFGDASFDAVVAYGGPISYSFEQAEEPAAVTGSRCALTMADTIVSTTTRSLLFTAQQVPAEGVPFLVGHIIECHFVIAGQRPRAASRVRWREHGQMRFGRLDRDALRRVEGRLGRTASAGARADLVAAGRGAA